MKPVWSWPGATALMMSAGNDGTAVFAAIFLSISRRLRRSRAVRPCLTFTFYHEGFYVFFTFIVFGTFLLSSPHILIFKQMSPDVWGVWHSSQNRRDSIWHCLFSTLFSVGSFSGCFSLSGLQPRRWWVWSVAIQTLRPPLPHWVWRHGRASGDCTGLRSPLRWRCLHTRSVWI